MSEGKWRLPHGVGELLPPAAGALEALRRNLVDLFVSWGYEHIEPPLVEYLDSLLVGSGADLDLQTLKVVDQRSGRMLGVRADMSSQAARIDAHSRPVDGVQRLCYAGPVVFANPRGALDTRNPFKAGAELFGCADLEADAEVIRLMLAALAICGMPKPVLLLGHMRIYRTLVAELSLSVDQERLLFAAMQRKSERDIADLLPAGQSRDLLVRLPTMMGRAEALGEFRAEFGGAQPAVQSAIDDLERLSESVDMPGLEIRYDLAELAGYGYHNGPVFSAYQGDQGASIAQGGRYDDVGASFGRARPATGFDVRLERLVSVLEAPAAAVWAPFAPENRALTEKVAELRREHVVVSALSADDGMDPRCVSELVLEGDDWVVREVNMQKGGA